MALYNQVSFETGNDRQQPLENKFADPENREHLLFKRDCGELCTLHGSFVYRYIQRI